MPEEETAGRSPFYFERPAIDGEATPTTLSSMDSLLHAYLEDRTLEGDPPEGAFSGAAGGAACGDLARISLLPGSHPTRSAADAGQRNDAAGGNGAAASGGHAAADRRIAEVTFGTEGCAATRAACSCVAGMVDGATMLEAARIGPDDIERELGGLGPAHRHAVVLAADALHRALSAAASSGVAFARPVPGRVLVAVSGGVDSAVAALRERELGRDVVAVTVKLWADPDTDGTKACCSPEAVLGARAVTHSLGIPHLTLDLEGPFRRRVVAEFLDGYSAGRTPNPCVLCNGEVRIQAMVALADRVGAERLITGHYARTVDDGEGWLIAAGEDRQKDQSYMLAALPPEAIRRLEFPLAGLTKPEVREIAATHGLAVAKKPESQDLCFLAGQSKRDFLRRHAGLTDRPGRILSEDGTVLGEHPGHHHFTVGQRRGLGVAATEPLYVLATDASENTVRVGSRNGLAAEKVAIRNVVMHRDGSRVDRVRLRYRTPPVPARVEARAGRHERLEVALDEPFDGPAPGQAAVLMDGDVVVGHGTITHGE